MEKVAKLNRFIASYALALAVLLTFLNVVLRYIFGTSLSFSAELSSYLFIVSAFFAASLGFKERIHISVDLISKKTFFGKFARYVSFWITLIFLLFIAIFGIEFVALAFNMNEISIDLNIPMWIIYMIIPISFFLAAFWHIRNDIK